jgi:hypothetical protein
MLSKCSLLKLVSKQNWISQDLRCDILGSNGCDGSWK